MQTHAFVLIAPPPPKKVNIFSSIIPISTRPKECLFTTSIWISQLSLLSGLKRSHSWGFARGGGGIEQAVDRKVRWELLGVEIGWKYIMLCMFLFMVFFFKSWESKYIWQCWGWVWEGHYWGYEWSDIVCVVLCCLRKVPSVFLFGRSDCHCGKYIFWGGLFSTRNLRSMSLLKLCSVCTPNKLSSKFSKKLCLFECFGRCSVLTYQITSEPNAFVEKIHDSIPD